MIKTVGIVSLSSGILGENFVKHELDLGIKRLNDFGIKVKIMPNALKGLEYLNLHPEARANDLISAFEDSQVDLILCAIGGNDTYRLIPYLMKNNALKQHLTNKIFLGYSDTTVNHFLLYKLGLKTFYGQSFLPDVCELEEDMLPYTKKYFLELLQTGTIKEITPSNTWYKERTDFSPKALNTKRIVFPNNKGFELLQGNYEFEGEILGGCIESIYENFLDQNSKAFEITFKYDIFPSLDQWKGKILLLETSESKSNPEKYKQMLLALKNYGIFDVINGVLIGKPQDEAYYDEYKEIITQVIPSNVPVLYNINIGHGVPKCIIPLGEKAHINAKEQIIKFI
ncbi:S66 family peptidase [Mycoplasma seminis]|uniref:LD-carboxypeptidase n=1 Tax=Mycoplasma seminis TaxID=512749 RepID=A0ABY9H9Y6_9MOLU|nr:S66 peptidase family protein [Mycoplasma seminis]WLP85347.1 LD-carboxypeptidase [Mycoplasma seminis]